MALMPSISAAARNAAANAVTALIGAGGKLRIYDGSVPGSPDVALSGQNLLSELALSSTPFAAASGGVATANAITTDPSADATGTPTFYRVVTSGGVAILQGSVGTSGCDMNISSATIFVGIPFSITSFTYTQPGS